MKASAEKVTFLVVDDDDVAIMGMKRAIKKLELTNPIEIARNGEEALHALRRSGEGSVNRPYIVTLDLNMPRMGGLQFLEEVRRDAELQDAIIFVVTTSDAPDDITSAYSQNIAGYIVKDNAYETLKNALDLLRNYTQVVRLPGSGPDACAELRLA